jgi:hypothetical protein
MEARIQVKRNSETACDFQGDKALDDTAQGADGVDGCRFV